MNKMKNTLFIISLLAMSISSCGSSSPIDLKANAPDYSSISATFDAFGYNPPTNGVYYEDGEYYYTGQDYRTVDRYEEYKDAGMTILMLQSLDQYDHRPFEESKLKIRMDDAQKAGLKKLIVQDAHLTQLSGCREPLVDPNGDYELTFSDVEPVMGGIHNFKSEQELIDKIAGIIKPYKDHPIFYGVLILDEPQRWRLPNWCLVYKALKTIDPDIYVEANLLPYFKNADCYFRYTNTDPYADPKEHYHVPTEKEAKDAYYKYVDDYFEWSGAKSVMMDSYPFLDRKTGTSPYISSNYFTGLQILGDICIKRNAEFEGVSQSMGGKYKGNPNWHCPNDAAMRWQFNSYLGLGCEKFGYFTYWRTINNNTNGEWFNDGESFVTSDGRLTSTYYSAQKIHSEMQRMAPTMSAYALNNLTCYVNDDGKIDTDYTKIEERNLTLFNRNNFNSNSGTVAFITELKDNKSGRKDQYMYMVLNALSPFAADGKADSKTVMNYSIQFDANRFNAAAVLYKGHTRLVALENGLYKSNIEAGNAEYIMPYKAG